ncbi:MAG: FumA C-terminus/TtdB family hydratase beta subunit [Eubacteriales bacterium]
MEKYNTSDIASWISTLRVGQQLLLSGTVYTARDAAHKLIDKALDDKTSLPFDIENSVIYYAGPTPAPPGAVIGSCGPTTSGRMDIFTPRLLDIGLGAMIGKGERSAQVVDAIVRNKKAYLCAIGGAGALAARCITSQEVIAYEQLGCESVKRLEFKDFPLIVAIDSTGGQIFKTGR